MNSRRGMAVAIGAVGPMVLIALLFANQWVNRKLLENELTRPDKAIAPLVQWLEFPYWRLTTQGHFLGFKYVAIMDISLLLFFVFVGVLAIVGVRVLDPARGALGALIIGWWAALIAGGAAGFVRGFLIKTLMSDLYPKSMSTSVMWQTVGQGLGFGFAYGWLAGVGALVAFTVTRNKGMGTQQAPAPAMPAHPSAMPYAPPSANPYGSPYGQPPAQPPGGPGWQPGSPQTPPQPPPPGSPPGSPPGGPPRPYDGGPPPPR